MVCSPEKINNLSSCMAQISLSFNIETSMTTIVIKTDFLEFIKEFDDSFIFRIITKKAFKNLGISFEETNSINLEKEIIFDTTDMQVQSIIYKSDDNKKDDILMIGSTEKYTWSDIHSSLSYIRLNSKLPSKKITNKPKKI